MMKRIAVMLLAVVLVLACGASAWALAMEYSPKHPIVQQPYWPAGLADFLRDSDPVYAFWANAQDNFYYTGDTEAFNAFLERYSRLQGTPLTLSIHIGPAKVGKIATYNQKVIAYDWHVFVVPPMIPDGGIVKGRENERIVTVELWLGGQVELREVKVPDNVRVTDGGDIAKFIAGIEKARTTDK